MDIKKLVESGILEEYTLGMLNNAEQQYVIRLCLQYPEIKAELTAIEIAYEQLAALTALNPSDSIKSRLLATLGFAEDLPALDLEHLPLTNADANHLQWIDALKHLI